MSKTRKLVCYLILFVVLSIFSGCGQNGVDRRGLVNRHTIIMGAYDPLAPLSVGNGRFCFTADITGLQTFLADYTGGIPLTTMAEWGWHSFPNPEGFALPDAFVLVDTYGREVPYPIKINTPQSNYLRANPHQISLARIGLKLINHRGETPEIDDLTSVDQQLDLWRGELHSSFVLEDVRSEILTICHPDHDQLSFSLRSRLIKEGKMSLMIQFPYASGTFGKDPANFNVPDRHQSGIASHDRQRIVLFHVMNGKEYHVVVRASVPLVCNSEGMHTYVLSPGDATEQINFNVGFYEIDQSFPIVSFNRAFKDNRRAWKKFWMSGGAVDLSGSSDLRWKELERRIVISKYLTAIQSQQKYPPQETGLTCNSWHGKFHLEMHWWHIVHFALWGRLDVFEKSLGYYHAILPRAEYFTQLQGYEGVRWPKMVSPEGIDAPSSIGPLLIWQQPHPIYYAELVYRQKPLHETLAYFGDIVEQTAAFMASYAVWNTLRGCYELGPPLISAREFGASLHGVTKNPTFELAYWHWGLKKANEWRERMGLQRIEKWDHIADNLAPWPVSEGIYVEQETPLVEHGGHPCMLAAYGLLPETPGLNKDTMLATLRHVMDHWQWGSTWGWDYPMIAMTAARLGQPEMAVEALLLERGKNRYLPNGHNFQANSLPVYLPGNGGLLAAIAIMCAGWDGGPEKHAPGFPDNGQWVVKWEGLNPVP